ncbi:23S rRNA (guanosine(2251)-2'-O)-methyltransferase RlmB [Longirhabdus pacifica]|uniref:23S rRNA (guanosine(2251)-2'-O)-methyltransferase RlmB n=1 Tax=Longirhabdus pacifica TaxID=2305227 RepID=UPI0010086BCA|nr:23S rRNA (guanosine(2251)-2'-O)-methyltransferase RlmB [Longirhabdus pacifica]
MSEYIGGKHAVTEALRANRTLHKLWISKQAQPSVVENIVDLAKQNGVVYQTADRRKLDQMLPDVAHQGVVAQVAAVDYVTVEDIVARAQRKNESPFLLILEEIEDAHNLGSILRTADAAGVHGVIIPKRRAVGLTSTVAKTSAGALEYVPVARVSNLGQQVKQLKEQGIWIVGTAGEAEQTLYDIDMTLPIAIVIGNEHKGLSRLMRERCDFLAKLPMFGQIQSLNASVAAALFTYEAVRQRGNGSV